MTNEHRTRIFAGTIILISVLLAYNYNADWIILSFFVGLDFLQSTFSKWCALETILKELGFGQQE